MKAVDFLNKLEGKDFFKEFKEKYVDFYLCAFFCILNKDEKQGDKINIDFFVPSEKKVAFSESPFSEISFSEHQENKEFKKLTDLKKLKIDLEDLWDEVERVKNEKKLTHNTGKIMGVLTADCWNLTCFSNGLDLLRIKLNPFTKEIIETKQESLNDMIKIKQTKK